MISIRHKTLLFCLFIPAMALSLQCKSRTNKSIADESALQSLGAPNGGILLHPPKGTGCLGVDASSVYIGGKLKIKFTNRRTNAPYLSWSPQGIAARNPCIIAVEFPQTLAGDISKPKTSTTLTALQILAESNQPSHIKLNVDVEYIGDKESLPVKETFAEIDPVAPLLVKDFNPAYKSQCGKFIMVLKLTPEDTQPKTPYTLDVRELSASVTTEACTQVK